MMQKFALACLVGLALMSGVRSASALGPVSAVSTSVNAQPNLLDASFFGRPYPYGYTGWGPCVRYIEVQTRWGLRLRRVWICR